MEDPDTVTVTASVEREVQASRVDLQVTIHGQAWFSGQAALRKAKEVRELVADLVEAGVPEDRIEVKGIEAAVSSGAFGKSSGAAYHLKIRLPDLELLAPAMTAVMGRKDALLSGLEWQYDDLDAVQHEMLAEALGKVRAKADLVCRAMGHEQLGIHRLVERCGDDEAPRRFLAPDDLSEGFQRARAGRALDDYSLGPASAGLSHSKTIEVAVHVQYRVAPTSAAGPST
jgi:uncharacterized protein YggE